jgi:hypothetical protein
MKNYKNNTKMFGICLLILGIVAIFSFGINATSAANSSSVYVSTHGNDDYDGLNATWTSGINGPKATIKNATGTVTSDGTVHIASGTYNESNIQINKNMNIIGENQKNTIINGQQSGNPIFTIASGINITIINLTLTNGTSWQDGGAIDNYGTLSISKSTFTNNSANRGGAIDNYGTLSVDTSTFINNTANYDYGGAINNENGGTLIVNKSTFRNNTASNHDLGAGGAIDNGSMATLTVNNSTFRNNTANYDYGGGAIYNFDGTLTVDNSTFTNNTATSGGGAIYNFDGTLTVKSSTFTNNSANRGGAIINDYGGIVTVKFSRIVGNSAIDIYNIGGSMNALDNWWGTNFVGTNPQDAGRVNFTVTKWIVLTVTAKPQTINDGDKSTVTADLLHDNLGNYLNPVNGHVPDGITVNFSSDGLGTINPETNNTTNGSTNTTFKGNFIGVSVVSATVDQQTVTTNITNQLTPTNSTTVNATTTTTKIPMQHTGIPIAGLILGILSVLGGSVMSRKK